MLGNCFFRLRIYFFRESNLMNDVLNMYITMLPLILSGIMNMVFVKKSKLYKKYNFPIDMHKTLKDGKRIFGDNKTAIGFISMIVFCIIIQVMYGAFCNLLSINEKNELYIYYKNTFTLNLTAGFLFGLSYMLFELPNSFIKRRLDIKPGKTARGIKGIFFVIDQIDSLLGVFLVLKFYNMMSLNKYLSCVVVGAVTHISVNLILFFTKIRKNI